jgi:archaellum biogenesis protein FlaJ (TadC family)
MRKGYASQVLVTGGTIADTGIPLVIGGFVGAIGSLIFILRTHAFDQGEKASEKQDRQSAVRRALVIFAIIAWFCLVAALALGDVAFIVTTGIMAIIASAGLVRLWSDPGQPQDSNGTDNGL